MSVNFEKTIDAHDAVTGNLPRTDDVQPIIDPFIRFDDKGAMRLYEQVSRYAPFPMNMGKDAPRGFTYEEACKYVDEALPNTGLLAREEPPVAAWACADTAVHAMYVIAAHSKRDDIDVSIINNDMARMAKVAGLINEFDGESHVDKPTPYANLTIICPPAATGGSLADISTLRNKIRIEGDVRAKEQGKIFDYMADEERAAITHEPSEYTEPGIIDVGPNMDPLAGPYQAKTVEHSLMSKWVAGEWAVLQDVGAYDEYTKAGHECACGTADAYDDLAFASGMSEYASMLQNRQSNDEIRTQELAYQAQARLENHVFPIICAHLQHGWVPSDEFKQVIDMSAVTEYADTYDIDIPEAVRDDIRQQPIHSMAAYRASKQEPWTHFDSDILHQKVESEMDEMVGYHERVEIMSHGSAVYNADKEIEQDMQQMYANIKQTADMTWPERGDIPVISPSLQKIIGSGYEAYEDWCEEVDRVADTVSASKAPSPERQAAESRLAQHASRLESLKEESDFALGQ